MKYSNLVFNKEEEINKFTTGRTVGAQVEFLRPIFSVNAVFRPIKKLFYKISFILRLFVLKELKVFTRKMYVARPKIISDL